jgi:DNA replication protein DnaC
MHPDRGGHSLDNVKSHLAIALGIAATEAGSRPFFTTAADIDELGYLPLDQPSANWIFQVVSRRADKGSVILTSNRGFGDWGQVFAEPNAAQCLTP